MSELRDLTAAFRSFDKRLNSIEDSMLVLLRDSQQQSEWRHEQKNRAQIDYSFELALKQVQEACGSISSKIAEVVERLDNQAAIRQSDMRGLNSRVQELEKKAGDEVTQT